ncbi:MAG TPA: DUF445 domain-containing protein [Pseudonocardiaceae bacterium]
MHVAAILVDLREHWPIYVSMPFVAAIIGYLTKRVAIEMMFRPVEFVGIRRTPIGWQGVLPRNGARMAVVATRLLTENLVDMAEIFSRLDPDQLIKEIEPALTDVVDDLLWDLADGYQPGLWDRLPEVTRRLIRGRVRAQVPRLVHRIMADLTTNIETVLDVEDIVVTHLVRDKELLNRLIRDIARPELTFIARCGFYFGFILGLVQMIVWALTHQPVVMPLFGLAVGWFTDWLALKMIFLPREPRRFLGLVTWQGLFQRRRREVAVDYGRLIADEILTTPRLIEAILRGPRSDRLFAVIQRELERVIDDQMGLARPLVVALSGPRFQELKLTAVRHAIERVPDTLRYAEEYTTQALDIRNTIVHKMLRLSPLEFEGILRPAFHQDEWKLIAVGAVIGFLVGELQVLVFPH